VKEALRVAIQTMLQDVITCGVVNVKFMPMGKEGTWDKFVSRQTTLDEFFGENVFPDKQQGNPPEITIHINILLVQEPQELGKVLKEIMEYAVLLNAQEMCA
jgi:hypothetical protein